MTAVLPFPVCVLPGCDAPVEDPTQPCDGCLAAFGDMLQPSERTITAEQVAERDAGIRAHNRWQAQFLAEADARAARDGNAA